MISVKKVGLRFFDLTLQEVLLPFALPVLGLFSISLSGESKRDGTSLVKKVELLWFILTLQSQNYNLHFDFQKVQNISNSNKQ